MEIGTKRDMALMRKEYQALLGVKIPYFTGMNIIEQHDILDYVIWLEFRLANKDKKIKELKIHAELMKKENIKNNVIDVFVSNVLFVCSDVLGIKKTKPNGLSVETYNKLWDDMEKAKGNYT